MQSLKNTFVHSEHAASLRHQKYHDILITMNVHYIAGIMKGYSNPPTPPSSFYFFPGLSFSIQTTHQMPHHYLPVTYLSVLLYINSNIPLIVLYLGDFS